MNTDDRVQEVLAQWEALREQGRSPTPTELCRDCPELVIQVERKIEELDRLDRRLASTPDHVLPLATTGSSVGPAQEWVASGDRAFRTLRFHAKGGQGEVFVARDGELGRPVALKRIQQRFAHDPRARQEFLREAEITGKLDHPGVAPVYGLVKDEKGSPCYAMRLIQGETLQDAIASFHKEKPDRASYRSLAFRELLTHFIAVCKTVAYAHSRGIIHRDLKPRNIVLGKYGETIVLDWGLAKQVERDETSRETGEDTVRPELSGDLDQIQSRKGKGTPAYMSPEQAKGDRGDVGLASDVFALGATLYPILVGRAPYENVDQASHGRYSPSRQVLPSIPPALDAICRKAMALKAEDRYGSALELAQDVQRWLADEPVTAFREPWSARLWRWARNHRGLVTGGLAGGIVGLLVLAVMTGFLNRAYQTEKQAKAAALHERDKTSRAFFELAAVTSERASKSRAISIYLQVLEMKEDLAREFPDVPDYQNGLAKGHYSLAGLYGDTGKPAQAVDEYQKALAIWNKLTIDHPTVPEYASNQATTLCSLGQYQEALAIQEELVHKYPAVAEYQSDLARTHSNLANLYGATEKWDQAAAEYQKALEIQERLAGSHPEVREFQDSLALSHSNLGVLYRNTGKPTQAADEYQKALGIWKKLVREHPTVTNYQFRLALGHNNLGLLYIATGKPALAAESLQMAVAVQEKVVRDNPTDTDFQKVLGGIHNGLGELYEGTKKPAEAREAYQKALAIKEKLAHDHPENPEFIVELAGNLCNLGSLVRDYDKPDNALGWYDKAIAALRAVLERQPSLAKAKEFLRISCSQRAEALNRLRRYAEAVSDWDQAVGLAPEPFRRPLRFGRADSLARAGEAARAVAEAEDLARSQTLAGLQVYNLACVFSLSARAVRADTKLASADRDRLAGRYEARAVELLARARDAGFFKEAGRLKEMEADADLDPVRTRAEYRKLWDEVQKGK